MSKELTQKECDEWMRKDKHAKDNAQLIIRLGIYFIFILCVSTVIKGFFF